MQANTALGVRADKDTGPDDGTSELSLKTSSLSTTRQRVRFSTVPLQFLPMLLARIVGPDGQEIAGPAPLQCDTATGLSATATCTQSEVDPYWGGGSLACSVLTDGNIGWLNHVKGRHVLPSGSVTLSWPDVKLVVEIIVYQRRDTSRAEFDSHPGFELQLQSLTTVAWMTVLAQTSWSQTSPGLAQNDQATT